MSTFHKIGAAVAATATLAAVSFVAARPADAATPKPVLYVGYAGGSRVSAADGTVTSGLTAQSSVQGFTFPASAHNEIASGDVNGLLSTGAVTTSITASNADGTAASSSVAETAAVNLLGGLIQADAVKTTATSSYDGSSLSSTVDTTFTNIKITNVTLPIDIPDNFRVRIPGIALVILNYSGTANTANSTQAFGAGAYIQLLAARGDSPLGTRVWLNPSYSALTTHIPNSPVVLGGNAYGTRLTAAALGTIGASSGPTAYQSLSTGGTGGQAVTNSTAAVSIPGVLETGAVTTTVKGSAFKNTGDANNSAAVAGVDLFGGLIHADAIKAVAHVHLNKDGSIKISDSTRLVGLTVDGHDLPVTAAPNTTIDVAGLGTVVLNQQYGNSFSTTVRAIAIKVTTARAGLPVGAIIEIGVASAYILS